MVFEVVLVEISRKNKKIPNFGRKILLPTAKNMEIHLPMCRPQISLKHILPLYRVTFGGRGLLRPLMKIKLSDTLTLSKKFFFSVMRTHFRLNFTNSCKLSDHARNLVKIVDLC